MHHKPKLSVIRLLNDLADRGAILELLGKSPGAIDADLIRYAERRIPPARPTEAAPPRDGRWVDGRWVDTPDDAVYC